MDTEQRIDIDEVRALQSALETMGANIALVTKEAAFWRIKAEGAQTKLDTFMGALKEKGVDLEELFAPEVPESPEDDEDGPQDDETAPEVSAPPKAPKKG